MNLKKLVFRPFFERSKKNYFKSWIVSFISFNGFSNSPGYQLLFIKRFIIHEMKEKKEISLFTLEWERIWMNFNSIYVQRENFNFNKNDTNEFWILPSFLYSNRRHFGKKRIFMNKKKRMKWMEVNASYSSCCRRFRF